MKKYILALAFSVVGVASTNAQIITGFGSSQVNPVPITALQTGWTGTQTSTVLNIVGTDIAGGIYSTNAASVTLNNLSQLTLTGQLTSMAPLPTSPFFVVLYDDSFNTLTYEFNWSSFSNGSLDSVTATSPVDSAFDGQVDSWGLQVDGTGTPFTFTFDQLAAPSEAAVPEPSTYAMLGLGMLALVVWQRRNKARLS